MNTCLRRVVALFTSFALLCATGAWGQQPPPPPFYSVRFDAAIEAPAYKRLEEILTQAQKADSPLVLLVINSAGGDVDVGRAIGRLIEDSPIPVLCLVDGEAASMAFYILQACDVRMMLRTALLMTHEPSNGVPMIGNRYDHQREVEVLTAIAGVLAMYEARRMKISTEALQARVKDGDWWMDAPAALSVGAVDEVFDSIPTAMAAVQARLTKK